MGGLRVVELQLTNGGARCVVSYAIQGQQQHTQAQHIIMSAQGPASMVLEARTRDWMSEAEFAVPCAIWARSAVPVRALLEGEDVIFFSFVSSDLGGCNRTSTRF